MNIFNKLYCRTFQFVFKAALPLLPYRQPEILKSVDDVPAVLKDNNIDKVFVVTDGGVMKCGLVDGLTASLSQANIEYSIYDKTMPNPTIAAVEEAREQYVND
ncbi:MAG: iron-containing alcohol dehydrogenase, partial [Clostridiales bacterium]|nr:iron-containing alcohol dehydrogenase [Clostridiales bacterium]